MTLPRDSGHPDIEQYHDRGADRAAIEAHALGCASCRARLADVERRRGQLPCDRVVELTTEYLERAADDRLLTQIDDHLGVCEACRTHLGQMRATLDVLADIGRRSEPPPADRTALIAAFRAWRERGPGPDEPGS